MEGRPRGNESPTSPVSPARLRKGFEVGDVVWLTCPRAGFRRATIVSLDDAKDSLFVESIDATDPSQSGQFPVLRSDVRPYYDSGPERTFEDNTAMAHLDDANILDNLRRRFSKDEIYTYTANVLLAVNPYKKLSHLYTSEKMSSYRGQNPGKLSPHPYAIADLAYRNMLRERQNQALVISGESGAGKTETAKLTMHYMTSVSRTDAAHGGRIQDKIIHANPILESFGNASTVRNMNSSRFGKYNEMCFNRVGSLVGAGIKTFLLESSRVVSQQPGERNYHVFYELLAGLDEESMERLELLPFGTYKLLHGSNRAQPMQEGSAEAERLSSQFQELKQALASFVDGEAEKEIWDILAALIHLGEVEFVDIAHPCDVGEADGCAGPPPQEGSYSSQSSKIEVATEGHDALAQAADLLGLKEYRLEQVLKWREMRVRRGERLSRIFCPRTKLQATQTLQCIIKILYKRLFDKIVEKINAASRGGIFGADGAGEKQSYNSIGTLDIYGFERLQTNSFEQLCINLANERLQQFFVEEVLDAEQRTYAEESLNIRELDLPNSAPVVNCIQGIMSILDEHSLRSIKNLSGGSGDDKDLRFCEHVHRQLIPADPKSKGPIMKLKMKGSRSSSGPGQHDGFQIRHYAGDVPYTTQNWIEKNNDALVPEVEALLADGSKALVRDLADKAHEAAAGERLHSVSTNYLTNLSYLLDTLKRCAVHYIRCFNPNQSRQPGAFDTRYVLDQVIQCGTVELVKIMHDGFPNRCFLKDLRDRFISLLPREFDHYQDRDFVHAVMLAFEIDETQWTLGTKRLFLKAGQLRVLENLRDLGSTASKEIIRRIRVQFARKKVRAWTCVISLVKWLPKYIKERRVIGITRSLKKATYVFVRLHRWLRKVRARLYGIEETLDAWDEDLKLYQHGLAFSLRPSWQVGNPAPGAPAQFARPEIFIALNTEQLPQYSAYLENQVDNAHSLHDSVLRLTQDNMSESVLLFTGRSVLSLRMNPKPFVRNRSSGRLFGNLAAEGESIGCRALDDLRAVDVHDTAMAVPIADASFTGDTVAMCQHQKNKQVFATCDSENRIMVWRWKGTETEDPMKPALKPLCTVPGSRRETVLKVCFLSEVPDRIASKGGYVLLKLSLPHGHNWLYISAIAVYAGGMKTEDVQEVLFFEPALETIRKCGAKISFFKMAHTERMLVVGGLGILQFWNVSEGPDGCLRLSCALDLLQSFSKIRAREFVSCLCLPSPVRSVRRSTNGSDQDTPITDWIVFGSNQGELYGFVVNCKQPGHAELVEGQSGRFRGCTHTEGVPVTLFGTFGDRPESHYQDIQKKGLSYSQYLRQPPMDKTSVCSLGADGKLMIWRFSDEGWAPHRESQVSGPRHGSVSSEVYRPVACHSSMLVPNALVFVDESRQQIVALDRFEPESISEQAICSLA